MKILRFIPAIIWMFVIFHFSSIQTTGVVGSATQRFFILKSFHLIEYAFLAILLFWAYLKYSPSIVTAYLYSLTDEFHQYFVPGRTSKFTDTLIDLLGISLGLIFMFIIVRHFKKSQNKIH
jgi:VanZ family protein